MVSKTARKKAKEKGVNVGKYSYGGCFKDNFNVGGSVTIGRYCSFAANIHYFGANHPTEKAVMSPYFYNKSFGFQVEDVERSHLFIGNDVWIGESVVITSSCHSIGNGAVIGAGTVVTKDIPPYAVVVGNPGHVIKFRFSKETIEKLEESRWWMLDPNQIMDYYSVINEPYAFAEKIAKSNKWG